MLAPGANCPVAITFTPNQAGVRSGSLTVNSNATNPIVGIRVRGVGRLGKIGIRPRTLNFGRVRVGFEPSPPKSIRLNNSNPVPMKIGRILLDNPLFEASGCIKTEIAPMSTCTFSVRFWPENTTSRETGTLSIEDDAAGSPHTVKLSGMGAPSGLGPEPDSDR